jgi:hypothetical protein
MSSPKSWMSETHSEVILSGARSSRSGLLAESKNPCHVPRSATFQNTTLGVLTHYAY